MKNSFFKRLMCAYSPTILLMVLLSVPVYALNETGSVRHASHIQEFVMLHPNASLAVLILIILAVILLLTIIFMTRSRNTKQIRNALNYDELTGLYSFYNFKKLAQARLDSSPRLAYVIAYVDIHKFKYINDVFGYDTGDNILLLFADAIKENTGDCDITARMYSDRFLIMLNASNIGNAKAQVELINDKFLKSVTDAGIATKPVFKVGLYQIQSDDLTITSVTDKAAYAHDQCAESELETTYSFYSSEIRNRIAEEKKIEGEMESALYNNQFVAFYQPKIDSIKNKIVGAEALVRWNHPEKGLIPPYKFIPLFERNGFISKIDYYMFEQVCIYQHDRKLDGRKLYPISCNFSALHLSEPDFSEKLIETAGRYEVDPQYLEIEITETVAAEKSNLVKQHFSLLMNDGFSLSIDDFGSGYSSLEIFNNIPAHYVKLDKGLIDNCNTDYSKQLVLFGVAYIAHSLGKKVVCEGVESKEQIDYLKSIECYIIQGYFYSKPLPINEFDEYSKQYE